MIVFKKILYNPDHREHNKIWNDAEYPKCFGQPVFTGNQLWKKFFLFFWGVYFYRRFNDSGMINGFLQIA